VAVTVVDPTAIPDTRPPSDTVPTPVALLDHVTTRPVSTLPAESFITAASCRVDPMFTLAGDGVTVTKATGTTVTVIADVPLLPSLVAVIVADPTPTADTRPLADTVATAGALLDHVMTRPVRTVPAESLVVAISCTVVPMRSVLVAGATVTDATGTIVTVIPAVPLLPSLVAVIVADPADTPVTTPLAETVATPGALLDQVIVRPVSTLPAESLVIALSCVVAPTLRLSELGDTATVATATRFTVTDAAPLFPSLVAVMVTDPAATAVTMPLAETIATAGALLDHVTMRPVSTLPAESVVTAPSCTVFPIVMLVLGGVTLTELTGTTVTVMVAVPLLPSLVAVIVAEPADTADTNPLLDTVVTPGALLDQLIDRPVSVLPAASLSAAVSWVEAPI
jgi:hypothetical protein